MVVQQPTSKDRSATYPWTRTVSVVVSTSEDQLEEVAAIEATTIATTFRMETPHIVRHLYYPTTCILSIEVTVITTSLGLVDVRKERWTAEVACVGVG
jgi:hypothetical protein